MGTHYRGTADEVRALDSYIKLMRAADSIAARIERLLKVQGLTISQFGVLEALYHLGPMCQRQLGTKLLERGPRGVRITKSGELFYKRARAITGELRRVREELEELKGSTSGHVALGTTPGPGGLDRIVPEAIARDYLLRGIAVLVAPPIEHAVIAPAETADRPAQRGPKARR